MADDYLLCENGLILLNFPPKGWPKRGGGGGGVLLAVFSVYQNHLAKNGQATFENKRRHLLRTLFMFKLIHDLPFHNFVLSSVSKYYINFFCLPVNPEKRFGLLAQLFHLSLNCYLWGKTIKSEHEQQKY